MSVSIKYKGNEIASMKATGTKTLNTEGKYCEGNISVENTELETEEKTVALSMASGDQVVTATSGKAMSKCTLKKPSTLVPANIVKGVMIGGVGGTAPVTTQLWLLPDAFVYGTSTGGLAFDVNFVSANMPFTRIEMTIEKQLIGGKKVATNIKYVAANGSFVQAATGNKTTGLSWGNSGYRKLEFDSRLNNSNPFYAWLSGTSGAEKLDNDAIAQDEATATITQNGTVNITPAWPYDAMKKTTATVNVPVPTLQTEKTISVTANGTVEVTPDEGYDGVKKVSVEVNVPSSGGEIGATADASVMGLASGTAKVIFEMPDGVIGGVGLTPNASVNFETKVGSVVVVVASDAMYIDGDSSNGIEVLPTNYNNRPFAAGESGYIAAAKVTEDAPTIVLG